MGNKELLDQLTEWARDIARIDPTRFDCRFYGECDSSIGNALWRGDGCSMSYVGRNYGSNVIDGGFRLVVVGIDHGEKGGDTYEGRRTGIEAYYQGDGRPFNPHYRGVVKTAATVFGDTGEHCRQNCTKACQKSRASTASQCVIDRIVQPNNVKCTPEDTIDPTSRATPKMKMNCSHHLAAELKRLHPDLVVFHGIGARWFVIPEFKKLGIDMEPIAAIRDAYDFVIYRSDILKTHFLFLYHPSRGWLGRQWETVVVPALKHLRSEKIIPAQGRGSSGHGLGVGSPVGGKPLGPDTEQIAIGSNRGTAVETPSTTNDWSDQLKARTRDVIGSWDILDARDGRLHLKHVVSGFGVMMEDDVQRGVLKVVDRRTGAETTFASVDELIAAGWALD